MANLINQHWVEPGVVGAMNGLVWRNARFFITGRPIADVLTELVEVERLDRSKNTV